MRSNVIIAVSLIIGCLFQQAAQAQISIAQTNNPNLAQLTIEWNSSPDSAVTGYRLYYGTNSGVYMGKVDAGNLCAVTVNVASRDVVYYSAVAAYNANGKESPFSNEISFSVPAQIQTNTQFAISISAPSKFQTSTQLANTSNTTDTANTASATNTSSTANTFPAVVAGHYEGLFYSASSIRLTNSGAFKADITTNGAYTAKLIQCGKTYSYSGSNFYGKTAFTPVSTKGPSLLLQWDATNADKLIGIVSNTWSSGLTAYRTPFSASTPTPLAGKYTLAIAGGSQSDGYSTLSITVSNNGGVLVGGQAADGGTVLETTALSAYGYWPLYSTVSNGVLFGWQTLLPGSTNLTGWAYWFKPTNSALDLYCATNLLGSVYTKKQAILNFTNRGLLVFSGGDLVNNLTNRFSLKNNIITDITKSNGLTLTFLTKWGLFSGSFTNPTTKKLTAFSGAVLQQQNKGVGAFQSTIQPGALWLTPAP